jgi:hypothetical protein
MGGFLVLGEVVCFTGNNHIITRALTFPQGCSQAGGGPAKDEPFVL